MLRVVAGAAGQEGLTELSTSNGNDEPPADEQVDAGIAERLAGVHFGEELAGEGVTTVAIDDAGQFVERRPDGTSAVVSRLDVPGDAGSIHDGDASDDVEDGDPRS